jgi:hypothetical protein
VRWQSEAATPLWKRPAHGKGGGGFRSWNTGEICTVVLRAKAASRCSLPPHYKDAHSGLPLHARNGIPRIDFGILRHVSLPQI